MTAPLVSFLLPTRQRVALATRSITRLAELAADPAAIEIVLGIDEDDKQSGVDIMFECLPLGVQLQVLPFEPMGYANLHRYNNALAKASRGAWLAIWNDDVLMETPQYDDVLRDQHAFVVLDPTVSNAAPVFRTGLFPVVPRQWLTTLGHLSANPHCDTYMFLIADALKIRRPGWTVYHDRYDETGQNADATYKARVYATENFYDNPDVLARLNWDARRLGRVLGRAPGGVMRVPLRSDARRERAWA